MVVTLCLFGLLSRPTPVLITHRVNSQTTNVSACKLLEIQFSSVQARDRPSGLRAFAEVLLEPSGRDVWLGCYSLLTGNIIR